MDESSSSAESTTTGEILECTQYANEEPGQPVDVVYRNNGDAPIYLVEQYGCLASFLTVKDPSGTALEWRSDGWVQSCEALMGPDAFCGGPGCIGSVLMINPGGFYRETWPAFVHERSELTPECDLGNPCGPGCVIHRTPTFSTYTFGAMAVNVECIDGDCDPCEFDENGACILILDFHEQGEEQVVVEASADYPTTGDLELVFE